MKKLDKLSREQLEELLEQLKEHTLSVEEELSKTKAELESLKKEDSSGVPAERADKPDEAEKVSRGSFYKLAAVRIVSVMLIVAAVTAIVSTYFFPVMRIYGSSMSSTLVDGDVAVMHKTEKLEHGDICGFYYGGRVLCKRVIGVEGDEINIDEEGTVFVNGKAVAEPYVKNKTLGDSDVEFPCTVPKDSYFVLGDNRRASVDSRNAVIGFVTKDQIAGRLLFCVLPLSDLGTIK